MGFPSSLRSGNPIFYIPPVFFAFRPNPMRVPGRPFFVYSPVLFPACVPHVDSRLRGSCHSGTGCRRMVSFWVPSGPFTGGRFPRRPWIPWSGTLRIAVPCLLGTTMALGWCLPGTVATYGWRHSGTDWCHSGTNPYIRGYLMALLLVISSMDLVASPPRYREQADFLSCAKHKATHSLAEDAG